MTLVGIRWGLFIRKMKPRLEAWYFQPHLLFSREGRGAGDGTSDQLYFLRKSSQNPDVRVLWSFVVGEHLEVLREGYTWRGHGSSVLLPTGLAYALPSGYSSVSCKINGQTLSKVSLSDRSHPSKLLNQRRGLELP